MQELEILQCNGLFYCTVVFDFSAACSCCFHPFVSSIPDHGMGISIVLTAGFVRVSGNSFAGVLESSRNKFVGV